MNVIGMNGKKLNDRRVSMFCAGAIFLFIALPILIFTTGEEVDKNRRNKK